MVFGHNSNVKFGDATYHVQTEDRGLPNALIDTTVHSQGRVLHRRTNNYLDLLPLDADRSEALKLRVDEQHRAVMEEIRNGTLQLPPPVVRQRVTVPAAVAPAAPAPPAIAPTLIVELTNAKTWLAGKRATLGITVRLSTAEPVAGCVVTAQLEGAAEPQQYQAAADAAGHAQIAFDMPRLSGGDVALVISAVFGTLRGGLRFQLKAKPRPPATA